MTAKREREREIFDVAKCLQTKRNVVKKSFPRWILTVASLVSTSFVSNRVWWLFLFFFSFCDRLKFVFIFNFVFNRLWCVIATRNFCAKEKSAKVACELRLTSCVWRVDDHLTFFHVNYVIDVTKLELKLLKILWNLLN